MSKRWAITAGMAVLVLAALIWADASLQPQQLPLCRKN